MFSRGTSQEVRVLVANSELAIKRGDYDAAIMMLSSVPASSPAYAKAQMVKADIFLQYHKDKLQYARCYQVNNPASVCVDPICGTVATTNTVLSCYLAD